MHMTHIEQTQKHVEHQTTQVHACKLQHMHVKYSATNM